jgi:hypothetical protein
MSKQTAVEWLVEELKKQKDILQNHFEQGKWNDDRCSEIDNCILLCEQAKQMDKEQKIKSYRDGRSDQQSERQSKFYNRTAEQYYNETYTNEK